METQAAHAGLIEKLRASLRDHGFTELAGLDAPYVGRLSLILTPRLWTMRRVCAVADLSIGVRSAAQVHVAYAKLRSMLAKEYGGFPWHQTVSTILVLVCWGITYAKLVEHSSKLSDRTGFHKNVILGTVLADREGHQCVGYSSFRYGSTGPLFADVQRSVREWCES